jgi:hypothetical protein
LSSQGIFSLYFSGGKSLLSFLLAFLMPSKLLTEVGVVKWIVGGAVYTQFGDLKRCLLILFRFLLLFRSPGNDQNTAVALTYESLLSFPCIILNRRRVSTHYGANQNLPPEHLTAPKTGITLPLALILPVLPGDRHPSH